MTQQVKNEASEKLSDTHSSIIDEIVASFEQPPCHGTITVTFIYRDSKLSRWISTREESRKVE
jgi:hypothetical protein